MPSRLDALRARCVGNVLAGIQSVIVTRDECVALLAVVEAAQEMVAGDCLRDDGGRPFCVTCGERMPCRRDDLRAALAALTTEEAR